MSNSEVPVGCGSVGTGLTEVPRSAGRRDVAVDAIVTGRAGRTFFLRAEIRLYHHHTNGRYIRRNQSSRILTQRFSSETSNATVTNVGDILPRDR